MKCKVTFKDDVSTVSYKGETLGEAAYWCAHHNHFWGTIAGMLNEALHTDDCDQAHEVIQFLFDREIILLPQSVPDFKPHPD